MKARKCECCGAPLKGARCEYCGTCFVEDLEGEDLEKFELEKARAQTEMNTMRQTSYLTSLLNTEFKPFK